MSVMHARRDVPPPFLKNNYILLPRARARSMSELVAGSDYVARHPTDLGYAVFPNSSEQPILLSQSVEFRCNHRKSGINEPAALRASAVALWLLAR